MTSQNKPWYLRPFTRYGVFRSVPMARLWSLLLAGFLLFSISGFYSDLLANGTRPYAVVLLTAALSGLNACVWIVGVAKLPAAFIVAFSLLQFAFGHIVSVLAHWMTARFGLRPVSSADGIHFAANAMLWASILSYVFFLRYIVGEGKRSLRTQGELQIAHDMQKTLVPTLELSAPCFEIYGASRPSERVGGDLVDAILLPGGGIVAFLADIAGHGLSASILMGRLKTAARTALLDAHLRDASETLPVLLERLNTILPQVKEPQMYATLTGFRLDVDGGIFCALAASPPILHWHSETGLFSQIQEPQFPLGLLPVQQFDGFPIATAPGDLLIVATDGILEAADRHEEEFGISRLADVISSSVKDPLPVIGRKMIAAAHLFGQQFDDQTVLIVRRL